MYISGVTIVLRWFQDVVDHHLPANPQASDLLVTHDWLWKKLLHVFQHSVILILKIMLKIEERMMYDVFTT